MASEKGKDQTVSVQYPDGVADRGLWDVKTLHQKCHRVNKLLCRRMVLEKPAAVGKSPVFETHAISHIIIQSLKIYSNSSFCLFVYSNLILLFTAKN